MNVTRYSVGFKDSESGRYAAMLDKQDGGYVSYEDYAALESRCAALAAENAESEKRMQQLIQVINNADNDYCMCGDEMKNHVHGGCGHPTGMFDYHYNQWLKSGNKTPATDAFMAEVRASVIPEGYVLVPQEMHLSSEAMEGICFHCGDGGFAFGEFTDGLLFVGAIDDSDGQKVHGLHIATADYPEEGCATVCAFQPAPSEGDAQLRKGVRS